MDKYKLVPVEPTKEMLEAGHYAMVDGYHPGGVYRTMLDAAPAVQGEPVAFDEDAALTPAEREFYTEIDERLAADIIRYARKLHTLYTAPQPAEQQPRLAKYQPCGCVVCTCEHETQCQGCGARCCGTHPVGQILNPAYQQVDRQALTKIHASRNAADLHARNRLLADALEQILGWRELRSGREFPIERIEDIARAALAAHRKQGGDV